jgi:hypothetical protein
MGFSVKFAALDGRIGGLGSADDDFQGYMGGTGGSGDPVFQRFYGPCL